MDLEKLRLKGETKTPQKKKPKGVKKNRKDYKRFVYIKHDAEAFHKAARLPGKAFQVYCAILERAVWKKSDTIVLTTVWLKKYGVGSKAKKAGLRNLEEAGLIKVIDWGTEKKKNPVVRISDSHRP